MGDVSLGLALFGFAVSVAVWAIAAWSAGRAIVAAIATAPPSWQQRFEEGYEAALAVRLRDFLVAPRTLWALTLWMAAFLVLDVFDVTLVVQLGAVVAYALWATLGERRRRQEELAGLVRGGLEPLPDHRGRSRWYDGSLLAAWVGFLSAACFLAVLIVDLAGG